MDDELLSRPAPLVGVMYAGVDECVLHPLAVNRDSGMAGMLLDDREQIAEQPLLRRGQLGPLGRGLRGSVLDAIDARPRRDQR